MAMNAKTKLSAMIPFMVPLSAARRVPTSPVPFASRASMPSSRGTPPQHERRPKRPPLDVDSFFERALSAEYGGRVPFDRFHGRRLFGARHLCVEIGIAAVSGNERFDGIRRWFCFTAAVSQGKGRIAPRHPHDLVRDPAQQQLGLAGTEPSAFLVHSEEPVAVRVVADRDIRTGYFGSVTAQAIRCSPAHRPPRRVAACAGKDLYLDHRVPRAKRRARRPPACRSRKSSGISAWAMRTRCVVVPALRLRVARTGAAPGPRLCARKTSRRSPRRSRLLRTRHRS